ncbi:MAG: preprotein translocase subunit YajC [Ignavibacteria bacterium]|nr:preprotein translocase subunit YajC [Ignavibacteria bacterium]MBP7094333.1 preprotein translocase subunit YajC [Candidatus Kapabacteria bacterium]MBK6417952.1 preprotein translocase subunit YajC [Ignavibacteria bacterium]MBK6417998.1 preprotein translocase subunit YajC [Ignavibacteria bacterium]MBK6760972.1 preprotein translocase subunit YajC [Ignavibacteria bacterium]
MLALFLMSPAPAGGAGGDTTGQLIQTVVMFGAVIAIFYFMMIRPQQKRAKEHQKLLASIKKGDAVVTSSGIHGTVYEVDETTITVTIASNTNVKFDKSSVGTVVAK